MYFAEALYDLTPIEDLMDAYQLPERSDDHDATQDCWDLCEYLCAHRTDREAQLYA